MVSRSGINQRIHACESLVAAQQKRFDLADTRARYQQGVEFDARQDLHAARQILILPRLTNAVGLYKARMVGCASRNLLQ